MDGAAGPADGAAGPASEAGVLALARHFAAYRSFYRAMVTGSCAFVMTRTLDALFSSANQAAVRELFGPLDAEAAQDLARFVAAGTGGIVNDWLIDAADPLDPEDLAHRLLRLRAAFAAGRADRPLR